ncbi:tetratricopeptide repeat protein [Azospirillum sp. ST 5-10]|uniref:class I SAM-dependent DNA methyltransferase n=1 Tax=unclassified Azospirillum TaxID=2630922 RepID=UPI003F49B85C
MTDRPSPQRASALRRSAHADRLARLFARASGLAGEGRLDDAVAAYRRLLAADPGHAEAYNNLGSVLDAQGHHAAAVAAYRRVLRLGRDHPAVHYNIGSTLNRAGRRTAAARSLRRALALAPDYAEAHNNLGNLLRESDPEAAAAVYRRAAACRPDLVMAHDNLGSALYLLHEAGATAVAARLAALWLRDHPEQPLARHAAAAMAGIGDEARAADGYVRLLFDGFAKDFERTLAGLDYRAPALLAAAVAADIGADIKAGAATAVAALDVLDAGCGTGLCGPFLRPLARRLVGVDLSPAMLDRARERGLYDTLDEAELGAFLAASPAAFDLIVAADVLCYFGPLDGILAEAARALRPRGLLAFTVERSADGADHRLNPHGRYAHGEGHVRGALTGAGLAPVRIEAAVLRQESGRPVDGLVVTARRPGASQ